MSMQVGEKGATIAEINVTPMADVMIVLLIIFMVVTPMISKGVDVNLPKASNTTEKKGESAAIEVAIRKDSVLFLGGVRVDGPNDLRDKVKTRLEDMPDGAKLVQLKADVELPYAEVMKVMDLVREAGCEEVALIAEKKVEG
jgi:biopolymer transport protein ExbD/biopolymer transport protein TolR